MVLFIGWIVASIGGLNVCLGLDVIGLQVWAAGVIIGLLLSMPVAFWTDQRLGWWSVRMFGCHDDSARLALLLNREKRGTRVAEGVQWR